MHVRAAIRNGLTAAEIGEVLLHTAVYAGAPAANAAFAIAQRTLAELGEPTARPPTPDRVRSWTWGGRAKPRPTPSRRTAVPTTCSRWSAGWP